MQNNYAYTLWLLLAVLTGLKSLAQTDSATGSTQSVLKEVTVSAYLSQRPVLRLPGSVAVVDSSVLSKQHGQSLVPALNTVSGIRMEERSPGSYRLSVRGSLIRSPFGIRNTKVYTDEFPLTNAGGESYLNLIDPNSMATIEVLKGPDGSLFGANSGGVIRIMPYLPNNRQSYINIGIAGGSYGLLQHHVAAQQYIDKNIIGIYASWQRADGYREHSAMDRKFFQLTNRYAYSDKGEMRFLFFYSDLKYETPGGLTFSQYQKNPQLSRPATAFTPGAAEQNAGIRNRTFYGGFLHQYHFNNRISHMLSLVSSRTTFENPFITNYEIRNEDNTGARTWFEFRNKNKTNIQLIFNIGAEAQVMQSNISNYGNSLGLKDTVQAIDNMKTLQGFGFIRAAADFYNKLFVEASLSYNLNRFIYSRDAPIETPVSKRNFGPQLMPRIAVSYLLTNYFSLRAIASKGYSPPTLQEIRSSDNSINTGLNPESGWNYEAGYRLRTKDNRFWWDVSCYYYELSNAIVKRINDAGQDYFVNAGGTYQRGIESQLSLQIIKPRKQKLIRFLELSNAYTWQNFTFYNYRNGISNYSGNSVTGVPQQVSVTGITTGFPLGLYFFCQYNYTSAIPLNDSNTEYATEYHLVQVKAGWRYSNNKRFTIDISAGADNVLNQKYSLGNDLNAIGNRYYNAAPGINYFSKINLWF